jgi:perosamine synthetase
VKTVVSKHGQLTRTPLQIGVGTLEITTREKELVNEVLESNRLSYGPMSRRFEREFGSLHQCSHAVLLNSGTSALRIAVACLKETEGWQKGDEIIVPALTFVATANVVIDHDFAPVFVDCDSRTYNINPALIERAITPRTKAIIPVHLFGQIADMDPILAIAKKRGLKVIEDSCETVGVTYKGRKAGSFGDISCFSTYVAHLIVTGVGGFVLTQNAEYAEILRSLANHGRDSLYLSIDDDRDIDDSALQEVIKRRFRFVRPGYSFRLTEMEAAIGVGQLERLSENLTKRGKNAAYLTEHLRRFEKVLQLPWYDEGAQEHAFMMFPIVIRSGASFTKEDLVMHLEKWNIETRDMLPLINQPVYAHFDIRQEDYPVADWVNRNGFYIGCHQGLTEHDLTYIVSVFEDFFSSLTR